MSTKSRTEYRQLLDAAQPGQAEHQRHTHALAVIAAIAAWPPLSVWDELAEWPLRFDAHQREHALHARNLAIIRAHPDYRDAMARTRHWVLSKHGQFQLHADSYRRHRAYVGACRRQLLDGRLTPSQYTTQVAQAKADMRQRIAEYERQTDTPSPYKLRKQVEWIARQIENSSSTPLT